MKETARAKGVSLWSHMTPNPVIVDRETSLDDAIQIMHRYGFRHLPVVECNRVVGMLSDRDLRLATSLQPEPKRNRDQGGNRLGGPERVADVMRAPVHCLTPDVSAAVAAKDMVQRRIGAIPVVEGDWVVGIVTETNFLKALLELCRRDPYSCDDVAKNHMHRGLRFVPAEARVEDALETMDPRVGHVCVGSEHELVGIVSERDLRMGLARESIRDAKAEAAARMEDPSVTVAEVMTRDVLTVGPDSPISGCAHTLVHRHVSALPVLKDGRAIGILTQRDVLEYFAHLV